jgi:DNA-directed RNA polymerase subunit RPC12/RpoP
MQILNKGKRPGELQAKGKCNTCNASVKFKQKEAKFVADQRDGDYYEISCPTCENKITVAADLFK